MVEIYGQFLNVTSLLQCQTLGQIVNYNAASGECRVYINNQQNSNNCTFSVQPKLAISNVWGYAYTGTNDSCEGICQGLNDCSSFRNDSGCLLYNSYATFVNVSTSGLFVKSCQEQTAPMPNPKNLPTPLNTNNAMNAVITACAIIGVLILVIAFFIILHRKRSKKIKKMQEARARMSTSEIGEKAEEISTKQFLENQNIDLKQLENFLILTDIDETDEVLPFEMRNGEPNSSPGSDNFFGLNRVRSGHL